MSALSTFPALHPLAMMVVFVLIPPTLFAVLFVHASKDHEWRGGLRKQFICNLSVVLNNYAPVLACVNIFLAALLFINQGVYFYNNLEPSSNINYYLRVNRPEFINSNLITAAQAYNSIDVLKSQLPSPSRGLLSGSNDWDRTTRPGWAQEHGRSLVDSVVTSAPTDVLNLIYHRSDWGDVISSEQLTDICLTERNILANVDCIETQSSYTFRSFIKDHFDPATCEYVTSFEDAQAQVGQFVNSRYFSDRTMYSSIRSPILITYLRIGTCGALYNTEEFAALLNAQTVSDTVVQHVSFKFLGDDLSTATDDLRDVMFYSTLFAFLFLIFSVRGIVTAVTTLFCIALSMVNAGLLLGSFGFEGFSGLNAACLLIMLSIGAGFVHLFGVAWRHTVRRGEDVYPQCLARIFGTAGLGNLLTFLACCLAFFALGTAPVIFISQLGIYVGMSMFLFLLLFAYVIMPVWVWTSGFPVPKRYYTKIRLCQQRYCLPYVHGMHHHHRADSISDVDSGIYSSREAGSDEEPFEVGDAVAGGGDDGQGSRGDSDSQSSLDFSIASLATTTLDTLHSFYLRLNDVPEDQAEDEAEDEDERAAREVGEYDSRGENAVEAAAPSSPPPQAEAVSERPTDCEEVEVEICLSNEGIIDSDLPTTLAAAEAEDCLSVAVHDGSVHGQSSVWKTAAFAAFRGKRPLTVCSTSMLLLTLFLFFLSLFLSLGRVEMDISYTQLVDEPSNLATVLEIFQYHRGDVFYAIEGDKAGILDVSGNRTFAPTSMPTPVPTVVPGNPTAAPTPIPSVSFKPTAAPTTAATGDSGEPISEYTDYRITGCWGLSAHMDQRDSAVEPQFEYASFRDYMEKDHEGIVGDFVATCDYVDSHRDYLNVHPDWNRSTDCIADQYLQVYNSSYFALHGTERTVASTLIAWGWTQDSAATLIGLQTATEPVWVCANFTSRAYVNSFHDDMGYGAEMRQRWENVFYEYGSKYGKQNGISTVVGSTEFTFPLLGRYITALVQYQAAVFIAGFALLFLVINLFDFGLTFFGVLGQFTAYLLTILIGSQLLSSALNLSDVVALVLILPLLVFFNAHLTSSFQNNQLRSKRSAIAEGTPYQLLPVLWKTHTYAAASLSGQMVLAVVAAVAFTWSEYPMLRRFGYYYIICAVVAYLFSVVVQPFLLPFSTPSAFCAFLVEDEDEEPVPHIPFWADPDSYGGATIIPGTATIKRLAREEVEDHGSHAHRHVHQHHHHRGRYEDSPGCQLEMNDVLYHTNTAMNSSQITMSDGMQALCFQPPPLPSPPPPPPRLTAAVSALPPRSNLSAAALRRSAVSWSDQHSPDAHADADDAGGGCGEIRGEDCLRSGPAVVHSLSPPRQPSAGRYIPYELSHGTPLPRGGRYSSPSNPVPVQVPVQVPPPLQQASQLVPVIPVQPVQPVLITPPPDSRVLLQMVIEPRQLRPPQVTTPPMPPQRYIAGYRRIPSSMSAMQPPPSPTTPPPSPDRDTGNHHSSSSGGARNEDDQSAFVTMGGGSGDRRSPPQRGDSRVPTANAVSRQMHLPRRIQSAPTPSFFNLNLNANTNANSAAAAQPSRASSLQSMHSHSVDESQECSAHEFNSYINRVTAGTSSAGTAEQASVTSTTEIDGNAVTGRSAAALSEMIPTQPQKHHRHHHQHRQQQEQEHQYQHARQLRPVRTPPTDLGNN